MGAWGAPRRPRGCGLAGARGDDNHIGEMRVGDETRLLTPGETYSIPSNTPHAVVKTGPAGCVVMDIFAPVRADWEKLERAQPSPGSWP